VPGGRGKGLALLNGGFIPGAGPAELNYPSGRYRSGGCAGGHPPTQSLGADPLDPCPASDRLFLRSTLHTVAEDYWSPLFAF